VHSRGYRNGANNLPLWHWRRVSGV